MDNAEEPIATPWVAPASREKPVRRKSAGKRRRTRWNWLLILLLICSIPFGASYFSPFYLEFGSNEDLWSYVFLKNGGLTLVWMDDDTPPNFTPGRRELSMYEIWRELYRRREFTIRQTGNHAIDEYESIRDLEKGRKKYQTNEWIDKRIARERRSIDKQLAQLRRQFAPLVDDDVRKRTTLGFYFHFDSQSTLQTLIRVPLWTPIVPLSLVVLWMLSGKRAAARRRRKGLCGECGYSVEGNVSGICPECGEELAASQRHSKPLAIIEDSDATKCEDLPAKA